MHIHTFIKLAASRGKRSVTLWRPSVCLSRYFLTLTERATYFQHYKNKNWLQFLFIVKAAVLKQQISKFYPQILSTEDSFYIYERPLTEINVIASFCALNLWIKFRYLLF